MKNKDFLYGVKIGAIASGSVTFVMLWTLWILL